MFIAFVERKGWLRMESGRITLLPLGQLPIAQDDGKEPRTTVTAYAPILRGLPTDRPDGFVDERFGSPLSQWWPL